MAKVTKREMFTSIINFIESNGGSSEMIDFCNHEIELINARGSAIRKPTAKDRENDALMQNIVELLENSDTPLTIPDILAQLDGSYSNQKINALLIKMRGAGTVERTYVEKHKAAFKIPAVDVTEVEAV